MQTNEAVGGRWISEAGTQILICIVSSMYRSWLGRRMELFLATRKHVLVLSSAQDVASCGTADGAPVSYARTLQSAHMCAAPPL